jgi:hypothetical protein
MLDVITDPLPRAPHQDPIIVIKTICEQRSTAMKTAINGFLIEHKNKHTLSVVFPMCADRRICGICFVNLMRY